MVKEKNVEEEQAEVLKKVFEKPIEDGFRKGISKKDLVKSLTPEDWVRIDKTKQAQERESNKYSYKFFIDSDQMVVQFNDVLNNVQMNISNIYLIQSTIDRNNTDLSIGKTEKKNGSGEVMSMMELEAHNMDLDAKAKRLLRLVKADLSRAYTFINAIGLDKKVFFVEEQYNEYVEDAIRKLSRTNYKLY